MGEKGGSGRERGGHSWGGMSLGCSQLLPTNPTRERSTKGLRARRFILGSGSQPEVPLVLTAVIESQKTVRKKRESTLQRSGTRGGKEK